MMFFLDFLISPVNRSLNNTIQFDVAYALWIDKKHVKSFFLNIKTEEKCYIVFYTFY